MTSHSIYTLSFQHLSLTLVFWKVIGIDTDIGSIFLLFTSVWISVCQSFICWWPFVFFFFLSVLALMNKVTTADSLCVGACSHFILPLPRCRVYIHGCLIFQKLLSCFTYPLYHLSFPSNIWLTSSSQKVNIASLFSLSPSNGICNIIVLFYSSQMAKVVDYHLCLLIKNISLKK